MKILELFAGSRSIGKAAEKRGHEVFSVDWKAFEGIDLVIDIMELTPQMIPFVPDGVWGSPDCTTYSIAGVGHHRDGQIPISEAAKMADELTKHTLKLIEHYKGALWGLENPRGMLRKMGFMKPYDRRTVSYCKYGDNRMKPTDIWGNFFQDMFNPDGWQPRPMCYNQNPHCHHEYSPRGETIRKAKESGIELATGGTSALNGSYERSKIPEKLCEEIIKCWEIQYELSKTFDIFGVSK